MLSLFILLYHLFKSFNALLKELFDLNCLILHFRIFFEDLLIVTIDISEKREYASELVAEVGSFQFEDIAVCNLVMIMNHYLPTLILRLIIGMKFRNNKRCLTKTQWKFLIFYLSSYCFTYCIYSFSILSELYFKYQSIKL